MTHENIQSGNHTSQPAPRIVPTRVAFRSGGALAIESDGTMFFIRDSEERVPFLPARRATGYNIATNLEPSHQVLHLHRSMSGVLNIDAEGKLSSVFGPCVHPFLPGDTVVAFFGRIELDDGTAVSFDHEGRIFEIPEPSGHTPEARLPDLPEDTERPPQRSIDYSELCRRVSMPKVLEIIDWKPQSRHGPELEGRCPIHASSEQGDSTFFVDLMLDTFECSEPGCTKGNQLDLFAAVTGASLFDAAIELCEKTATQIPWIA